MYKALILLLLTLITVFGSLENPEIYKEGAQKDEYFPIENSKYHNTPREGRRPLEIYINLDESPLIRWKNVTDYYNNSHHLISLKRMLPELLLDFPFYLKFLFWVADKVFINVLNDRNIISESMAELYQEYIGIANDIGVDSYMIFLLNFMFELNAHCTGFITHDKDGHIIHGRNLDFPELEKMRNITYQGNFYKGGKLLFNAIMMAGYTGSFTMMKPGVFAVNVNERNTNIEAALLNSLYAYLSGQTPPSIVARRAWEQKDNFNDAVEYMKNQLLISPWYFVVSGVNENEGAVIARDRNGLTDVWKLNKDSPEDSVLVATNYDHWVESPTHDKNRANYVKHYIKKIGIEDLTKENAMSQVLQQPMVFRSWGVHSSVISARIDYEEETSCKDCAGAYMTTVVYR